MKRSICGLCVVLACSAVVWGSPAGAKCLVPRVFLEPAEGVPGTAALVSGNAKLDCGLSNQSAPPPEALTIRFQQGGRVVDLGTVTPDGDGDYSASLAVPPDARPGPAVFSADRAKAGFTVGPAELPATGLGSRPLLAGAVTLLLVGVGALRVARRPKPR
ncbi:MAG: hypothetical protein ACRDKW_12085 [Actinomycetota bacterium]